MTEVAHLERAHYLLQSGLYFTETVALEGGSAYFSAGITEPEWNHAALLRAATPSDTVALLRQVEQLFTSRHLVPAVEVGPSSCAQDLSAILEERGYERLYRYAWLIAERDPGTKTFESDDRTSIREVRSQRDVEEFFSIFRATYPGDLESGYARAFARPRSRSSRYEVIHHLATVGGKPAAIATSIYGGSGAAQGLTGLYNLAVHPNHRRRGLGRLLTQVRVAEAGRRGHDAFLQTERGSVERWQRRNGFRLAFTTEGWARRSDAPAKTPTNLTVDDL